tara:strand:+ start:3397 stop:4602 length:1206 start_codon:yes stop_codon:yes gene_type:complete
MKIAGILTIGNEILQGYTVDLNANSISKKLIKRNIKTTIHLTVPDEIPKIKEKVEKFIIKGYDYIFITGGLGPTHDDVTKLALSELFNSKFKFLKDRHIKISKKFNKASLPECQSEILDLAKPLENSIGTALGMYFKYNNTELVILPGIPIEMNAMLKLYLNKEKALKIIDNNIITINTAGIYETKLSDMMQEFIKKYDQYVSVSFLPSYEGVKIRLTDLGTGFNIDLIKDELLDFLQNYAYGKDKETLEVAVSNILKKNRLKLSLAESCTGGYIAKRITDIPGSSEFFLGGIVAYDNYVKQNILGVPLDDINRFGAVSIQISESMAINILKKFNSDISIACTGISGPDGGTDEKPVGTVCISVKYLDKLVSKKFIFRVDRKSHRLMTKQASLYMLWSLIK